MFAHYPSSLERGACWLEFLSMARFHAKQKVTFAERFGMIVGGGAVLAVVSFQVLFVARMAGFGW